jgi:hypothetical protein
MLGHMARAKPGTPIEDYQEITNPTKAEKTHKEGEFNDSSGVP